MNLIYFKVVLIVSDVIHLFVYVIYIPFSVNYLFLFIFLLACYSLLLRKSI